MTDAQKLVMHGRNHRIGGSDPIEFPSGPYPSLYTIPIYVLPRFLWEDGFQGIEVDNAIPNNAVLCNYFDSANSPRTALNGDYFTLKLRLGPRGSRWCPFLGYKSGTDFGDIRFKWATPSEDGTPANGFSFNDGALEGADLLTYIDDGTAGIDCYSASPPLISYSSNDPIRIMGADGDPLTAFSNSTDFAGTRDADGGAGMWNVQVTVDGKNPTSNGYKVGIWELSFARVDEDGF